MNEREKLIEELQPLVGGQREYAERAVDWIIQDRKRIVEPLVKAIPEGKKYWNLEYINAVKETLKLAGLD